MLYALVWFSVLTLLGLWSLTAWVLHAAVIWTLSNASALSGAAPVVGHLALGDWLGPWVPPAVAQWVSHGLASLGPVAETLLQAAPALAGGVTVTTGVLWGIGSVLIVALGVALHVLIARRRRAGPDTPWARP